MSVGEGIVSVRPSREGGKRVNICARVWKGGYGGVKALMGGKERKILKCHLSGWWKYN